MPLGWAISKAPTWLAHTVRWGKGWPGPLPISGSLVNSKLGSLRATSTPKSQKRVWGWPYAPDITVSVCRAARGCWAPVSALLL